MKWIFLLVILFAQSVFAEDVTVFYAKGENKIVSNDGTEKKALKGDFLVEGDTLMTKDDSFVILKIGNHSTHRVEENTTIEIEKLPYNFADSEELEQGGSFILKVGTIFCEIMQKSDEESFRVKTANTTMGVRGTKLMASIDDIENDVWLSVEEGTVEVANTKTNQMDIIEKDKSMIIEKDKNFTNQQKYEWQKNLKWNIEKNTNDFTSFKKQRKFAYNEFKQRKTPWKRNEERWKQFKTNRQEKINQLREKVKNLKSNPNKVQRIKQLEKKMQDREKELKNTKKNKFYKQKMLKKNSDFKPNNFLDDKRPKPGVPTKLDEMKQQRRNLRKR